MKNLAAIKQEAREEFDLIRSMDDGDAWVDKKKARSFFEETLDRLLDEIEKAVVPEKECVFNHCRKEIQEAFTRFKGESECVCKNKGCNLRCYE